MHFFRLRLLAALLLGITLISLGSTYFDVLAHKHQSRVDLARKTQWFVTGLQPQLETQFAAGKRNDWPRVLERLRQHSDQPSLEVFDKALASLPFVRAVSSIVARFFGGTTWPAEPSRTASLSKTSRLG